MSALTPIRFSAYDPKALADVEGHLAIVVTPEGTMDQAARSANRLSKGAVARLIASDEFSKAKTGQVITLAWPAGLAVEALHVLVLPRRLTVTEARKAGAKLAEARGRKPLTVKTGNMSRAADLSLGLALRSYSFDAHKSAEADTAGTITIGHNKPEEIEVAFAPLLAVAEGVHMTRDLVNEPANVLTTTEFANRLEEMTSLGLEVEVLDEAALDALGMRMLLAVGQGSASPSKVVVMKWNGGDKDAAPLALVGKGVVFDTGGISLKPAAGMEDMTMDMGGAGVVA